ELRDPTCSSPEASPACFAIHFGIASGNLAIPGRMVGPRPGFGDGSMEHSAQRAGNSGSAFVQMNEESAEHDESHHVMEEVADPHRSSSEMLREPEENSGYEKDDSGDHHGPEPNLLPAVELANILRFWLVGLGGVVLGMAQPLPVRRLPTHLIRPSTQLEDDSN